MARILVWNKENDPNAQRGDIIHVYADGQIPGRLECFPRFLILEVSDSFDDIKHFADADIRDLGGDAPEVVSNYRYRFPVNEIAENDIADFKNNITSAIPISVDDVIDKQAF